MVVFPLMPFATTLMPSLAVGQFKAQLLEAGIPCQVMPCNFELMAAMGLGAYETIGKLRGINAQLGEWLFAREVWDTPCGPNDTTFFAGCPVELESLRMTNPQEFLLHLRDKVVPQFLDSCTERVLAIPDLRVVGFSCLFFQTMASAALAKRIKARRPELAIVFGGASFHGEMGEELIRVMPWIDAISIGEADDIIVPLFQALAAKQMPEGLQGIVWRDATARLHYGPDHCPASSALLEALPMPNYTEYFEAAARYGLLANPQAHNRIFVPYESSRGCWWGQKQHCTFCGLNAEGMSYRAKSATRTLKLIHQLRAAYPIAKLMATDNIMPYNYYEEFLPVLANDPIAKDLHLFFELKPNINRERVSRLAAAGVRSSVPGIESLSTHLLQCLKKGASGMMSVRTLKLFREYGIMPGWSVLMRIPGESAEDYALMTDLIPSLVHFWPPFGGPRKIELHRFSPYFFERDRYTRNRQPQAWYHSIYPAEQVDLSKIAYYFEADWNEVLPDSAYEPLSQRIWQWLDIWTERETLPRLSHDPAITSGPMELIDTRFGKHRTYRLNALEATIYRAIDEPATATTLARRLNNRDTPMAVEEAAVDETQIQHTLELFVKTRIALCEGNQFMALSLPATLTDPSLAERQAILQRVEQKAERGHKVC